MKVQLSHAHRSTYEAIVGHPASHNVQWRDVRSLLGAIAQVVEEPNGNVKVSRNGQTLVLHPDRHKDVGSDDQIKALRVFLNESEAATPVLIATGVNLLVVIDHREARIYKTELRGTIPERIVPYDPDGSGRYLHYVQNDSNGQRRPERRSFYDAIAKTMRDADAILVFGSGTGASSAMEQLSAELQQHHKELAAKVVGEVVVNEHHMTEDQLLAKAREFYANEPA